LSGAKKLAIDFTTVSNVEDQYEQTFVFDFADESVIADPVSQNSCKREPLRGWPILRGLSDLAS